MSSLISVIIPVYNAEKFVAEAILSVIKQQWEHWELLIINDGSTDRSESIIAGIRDSRIRYFSQPNRGVSVARNRGLSEMKGDFFCFLDADDVLPPHSLLSRMKVFERSGKISFADGAVEIFNGDLSIQLGSWQPAFQGNPFENLIRLTARCFFGPTWMVKVVPGKQYAFDESVTHGEDLLFYITISKEGGEYAYTDDVILRYRKNTGSAMTNLEGLARGYTALRERIHARFRKNISMRTWFVLWLKTRKIMFLSFLNAGKFARAFQYLLLGRI